MNSAGPVCPACYYLTRYLAVISTNPALHAAYLRMSAGETQQALDQAYYHATPDELRGVRQRLAALGLIGPEGAGAGV
jgi:hypothetical protein